MRTHIVPELKCSIKRMQSGTGISRLSTIDWTFLSSNDMFELRTGIRSQFVIGGVQCYVYENRGQK